MEKIVPNIHENKEIWDKSGNDKIYKTYYNEMELVEKIGKNEKYQHLTYNCRRKSRLLIFFYSEYNLCAY